METMVEYDIYEGSKISFIILQLEIVLFLCLSGAVGYQLYKVYTMPLSRTTNNSTSISLEGARTRKICILTLLCASISRFTSLVIEDVFSNNTHTIASNWFSYVVRTLPSMIFITTYSVVILFWCQVYHAASLAPVPIIKPIWMWANIVLYASYVTIGLHAYIFNVSNEFRYVSSILLGLSYIIISYLFFLYGSRVYLQLADRSRLIITNRQKIIKKRINLLRYTCPVFFLLRGLYSFCFGIQLFQHYYPHIFARPTWDAIVYITTEFIPSALVMLAFWYKKSKSGLLLGNNSMHGSSANVIDRGIKTPYDVNEGNAYVALDGGPRK